MRLQGAKPWQLKRDHKRWKKAEGPWLEAMLANVPPTVVYPENVAAFVVFSALRSQWVEPGEGSAAFRLPLAEIEVAVAQFCPPVYAHSAAKDVEEIERQRRELFARVLVMVQAARPVMTEVRIEALRSARAG